MATDERMLSDKFNKKITVVYGDNDWVPAIEEQAVREVVEKLDNGSQVITIPDCGHMMHFDNVFAVCNLVKNVMLGSNLPIGKDFVRDFKSV